MDELIEFFYWLTGVLGVALSAQGSGGLRLRRNAALAWQLTDPLGRLDFLFSEGHFNLIVLYLKESFARSAGALFLIISFALSALQPVHSGAARLSEPLVALFLGLVVFVLVWPGVHRICVQQAAAELERRVAQLLKVQPDEREHIERQLRSWFSKRVGREPVIRCDGTS